MTNETELEPNAAVYGTRAARSALADFVELAAVSGVPVDRSHLADYLTDAPWQIPADEAFIEPAVNDEDEQASADVVDSVFRLVSERLDLLGPRYPFLLDATGSLRFTGKRSPWLPYLALLAITVAHAYDIPTPRPVHEVFPETMTAVLGSRGIDCVCFSTLRSQMTFVEAVEACGEPLRLSPTPGYGIRSRHVNDAGGDVLAAVAWADARPGAWTFIGQATVGKSESWRQKAMEPSKSWPTFLNSGVPSVDFLGVPHHVEPRHLAWLVSETNRVVLDRLRLARFKDSVSPDEAAICDAVFAVPVIRLLL